MGISEAPVLAPLIPLGEFISKVGRPPSKTGMQVYLQRLREHGFNVSNTVRKALACGAQLDREVGVRDASVRHRPVGVNPCWLLLWPAAVAGAATGC